MNAFENDFVSVSKPTLEKLKKKKPGQIIPVFDVI